MTRFEWMPAELNALTQRWSTFFEAEKQTDARINMVRDELPALLANRTLFTQLIENITRGRPYPDIKTTAAFETEIILYLHPKRFFSIRMFLYAPGEFTPIHDHSSWGVTGTVNGTLGVLQYRRLDDGRTKGVAKIEKNAERRMVCGETEITQPLNEGIHQTGNPTGAPIIMISVYGSPMVRRLHMNGFDPDTSTVYPMYTPRLKKKKLAGALIKIL